MKVNRHQARHLLLVLLVIGLTETPAFAQTPGSVPPPSGVQEPATLPSVDQGYRQLKGGLADQAIKTFTTILAADPANLRAQVGLGLAQQKAGRIAKAIFEFQKALTLDPTNREAMRELGLLYSYQRETWPKAVSTLQTYVDLYPDDIDSQTLLAQVMVWQGNHKAAEQQLRQILMRQPENSEAKLNLARVITWQGHGREALPMFEELRSAGKFPKEARHDYALALRQTGDYAAAEKIYLQLVAEEPGNTQLRSELAQLNNERAQVKRDVTAGGSYTPAQIETLDRARGLHASGKSDEAIPLYRSVMAQRPGDEKLAAEFVDILASQPEYRAEALNLLAEMFKRNPSRQLQLQRAKILSWMPERRSEAIAIYREYWRQNPNDEEVRKTLSQSATWGEADTQYIPLYNDLLTFDPGNEALRLKLGQALIKRGSFSAALPHLEKLLRQNPDNFDARLALAGTYLGLNRTEDAEAQFKLLQQIDPRNPDVLTGLGGIEAQVGDYERARDTFERVLRLDQNNTLALAGLAGVYQGLGRPLDALPLLERVYAQTHDKKVGLDLVGLYRRLNRNDKAIRLLNELNPNRDNPEPSSAAPAPEEIRNVPQPVVSSARPPESEQAFIRMAETPRESSGKDKPRIVTVSPHPAPLEDAANAQPPVTGKVQEFYFQDPDDIRSDIQHDLAPTFKMRYVANQRSGEEAVGFLGDLRRETSFGALLTNRLIASVEFSPTPQARLGFDAEGTFLSTGTPVVLSTGQPFQNNSGPGFNGVAGRVRATLQPTERTRMAFSAGVSPKGDAVGTVDIAYQVNDTWQLRLDAWRQPVTESLLSFVGVRDSVGRVFGRTLDDGASLGIGVHFDPKTDLNIKASYSLYDSKTLANNYRRGVEANMGRDLGFKAFDYFRVSYQFTYFSFSEDQSTIPLQNATFGTLFTRGYFSPRSYINNGGRVDFAGTYAKRLQYRVGAQVGVQTSRARGNSSRFFRPGTDAGGQFLIELLYKFTETFAGGFDYEFTNAGTNFRSNRVGTTFTYKF